MEGITEREGDGNVVVLIERTAWNRSGADGRMRTNNVLIANQKQNNQLFPLLVLTGYVSPLFSSLYKKSGADGF
jgi:hypothetical protein